MPAGRAHIVVGDRLIAQAGAEVLAGRRPRFDNRASLSVPYLRAVVEAAGGWDGLVESLRRGARELIAVAERATDDQAATEVHVYIESGGRAVVDEPRPVGELLQGPAAVHLANPLGAAGGAADRLTSPWPEPGQEAGQAAHQATVHAGPEPGVRGRRHPPSAPSSAVAPAISNDMARPSAHAAWNASSPSPARISARIASCSPRSEGGRGQPIASRAEAAAP
jgi:hypothetical protein